MKSFIVRRNIERKTVYSEAKRHKRELHDNAAATTTATILLSHRRGTGVHYCRMARTLWWNHESTATTCNGRNCYATRTIEGEPETFGEWKKRTRIARYGIQPFIDACPYGLFKQIKCYHGSIHVTSWQRQAVFKTRKCKLRRRVPFETQKYGFDIYPVARLRLPTMFQYPPYVVREPYPLFSLRSPRTFSIQDLLNNGEVRILGKWCLLTENFIYHHPQCIAIRRLGRPALTQTKLVWDEELWAGPLSCGGPYAGCNGLLVRDYREQTKVCQTCAAVVIDQDIGLRIG